LNNFCWFDFDNRSGRGVKKKAAKRQLMTTVYSFVAPKQHVILNESSNMTTISLNFNPLFVYS